MGDERFLGIARPDLGDAEIEEILDTIRSGWLTSGPKVKRFEHELAAYIRAPHVRCLNSCTAGLWLALLLCDIGPGDEVLVPANTFASCANVVEHRGATPVFVDCDPSTGLLDLAHAEHLVGPRTRALMPVHLGGRPVDMHALGRLRDRYGIAIVEDAAHAIGARWDGRPLGSWGHLCSFSFHATKNMTTIEGGALVVGDAEQSARVGRLALHGLSDSAWSRHETTRPAVYDVDEPGYKFAMNDVAAAIGLHQLRRLEGWIERRAQLATAYEEQLRDLPLDLPPPVPPGARHAWHLYAVSLRPEAPVSRDDAVVALRHANIGTSVHFHGVHLHRFYRERYGLRPEDLPHASDWSSRSLTLPLHPGMEDDDIASVCGALTAALTSVQATV